MKHTSKIVSFFVFPITVLLSHLIASKVLHLYLLFPHLDVPYHFVGGLSIAYMSAQILSYLEKEKIFTTLNKMVFLVLIFSLAATSTVFWEFAEFIGDQLLDTNIQVSLANTMQDQFMGILGGATWVYIYSKRVEKVTENHISS
jgi:hypothetical protein